MEIKGGAVFVRTGDKFFYNVFSFPFGSRLFCPIRFGEHAVTSLGQGSSENMFWIKCVQIDAMLEWLVAFNGPLVDMCFSAHDMHPFSDKSPGEDARGDGGLVI